MTIARRFLVLMALLFWQGGFTFYGAVVVKVGTSVLGSHFDQGMITRSVTNYLNLAGVAALAICACDIAAANDPDVRRRRLRWGLWLLLAATLGILAWLHLRLDELIDVTTPRILDHSLFRERHRWYLIVSTAQWAASLIWTLATLLAWRSEDRRQAFARHDAGYKVIES